jgi:2-keto-4-pentenoate hydratase
MKTDIYERIAFNLREAQRNKSPIPPIRDEISDLGVDGAYKIQTINTHHYQNEGKRLCGRKIGLTSKSVQDQLGVSEPDYGVLFSYMALTDDETICAGDVLQPKVEAEVAFVLRRDLDMLEPHIADVIRATEFVLPAIEVVGSRIEKWNIGLLDTIADNASSGLFVLGGQPTKLDGLDLRLCRMVMEKQGLEVSTGSGAACLGNPINAVVWLARKMVLLGTPLRAGEVIMSGALGPMASANPGDSFEARLEGLGSVRVRFSSTN